jgi:hypothetical protein
MLLVDFPDCINYFLLDLITFCIRNPMRFILNFVIAKLRSVSCKNYLTRNILVSYPPNVTFKVPFPSYSTSVPLINSVSPFISPSLECESLNVVDVLRLPQLDRMISLFVPLTERDEYIVFESLSIQYCLRSLFKY